MCGSEGPLLTAPQAGAALSRARARREERAANAIVDDSLNKGAVYSSGGGGKVMRGEDPFPPPFCPPWTRAASARACCWCAALPRVALPHLGTAVHPCPRPGMPAALLSPRRPRVRKGVVASGPRGARGPAVRGRQPSRAAWSAAVVPPARSPRGVPRPDRQYAPRAWR